MMAKDNGRLFLHATWVPEKEKEKEKREGKAGKKAALVKNFWGTGEFKSLSIVVEKPPVEMARVYNLVSERAVSVAYGK